MAAASASAVVVAALLACPGTPLEGRTLTGATPLQLAAAAEPSPAQLHTLSLLQRALAGHS